MSFDLDKSLSGMRECGYGLIETVIPPDRVPLIRRSLLSTADTHRRAMADETGREENQVPPVLREVFDQLPANIKPLYRHWIALQHE
jgi:hypothetical protein